MSFFVRCDRCDRAVHVVPRRKQLVAVVVTVCAVVVALGCYAFYAVPLVRFRPVRMDSTQRLQASTEQLTAGQAEEVLGVLRQYSERCRRTDTGTVLITPALSMDTEFVWNYTSKAGL